MRSRRGFTVPEVLIAATLLVVLMAMMIGLLIPSFSLFRKHEGKTDTFRGCHILVDRFTRGLLNSQLETVTIHPDGQAITWQELQTEPPFSGASGEAIMSNRFTALHWVANQQGVVEETYGSTAPAGSVIPFRLEIPILDSLRSGTSITERVIARKVTNLTFTDNDGSIALLNPPLRLMVTCTSDTKGTASNDLEEFSMEASVTPRSQRW